MECLLTVYHIYCMPRILAWQQRILRRINHKVKSNISEISGFNTLQLFHPPFFQIPCLRSCYVFAGHDLSIFWTAHHHLLHGTVTQFPPVRSHPFQKLNECPEEGSFATLEMRQIPLKIRTLILPRFPCISQQSLTPDSPSYFSWMFWVCSSTRLVDISLAKFVKSHDDLRIYDRNQVGHLRPSQNTYFWGHPQK